MIIFQINTGALSEYKSPYHRFIPKRWRSRDPNRYSCPYSQQSTRGSPCGPQGVGECHGKAYPSLPSIAPTADLPSFTTPSWSSRNPEPEIVLKTSDKPHHPSSTFHPPPLFLRIKANRTDTSRSSWRAHLVPRPGPAELSGKAPASEPVQLFLLQGSAFADVRPASSPRRPVFLPPPRLKRWPFLRIFSHGSAFLPGTDQHPAGCRLLSCLPSGMPASGTRSLWCTLHPQSQQKRYRTLTERHGPRGKPPPASGNSCTAHLGAAPTLPRAPAATQPGDSAPHAAAVSGSPGLLLRSRGMRGASWSL